VVITGASSGVGALTALALALRHPGVRLVLAARGADPLARIAAACHRRGAAALAVPTDVADETAVAALADAAMVEYGRVDAWINNAAVAEWAPLIGAPAAELRRVVDTDLFGYVHGTQAALPRLTAAGGGVLVNNASVLAVVTMPYLAGYVLSKHAVRALSEVVRQELRVAGHRSISVCTLLPGTIDTPLWARAGNRTGRTLVPPPPVYRPERAALRLVRLLQHPRREAYVGTRAMLLAQAWRAAPGLTAAALAGYGAAAILAPDEARDNPGYLFHGQPPAGPRIHGGWRETHGATLRRAAGRGVAAAARVLSPDRPHPGAPAARAAPP